MKKNDTMAKMYFESIGKYYGVDIKKPIKNRFIQSFLYYVPYVTLSVMTFPAIVDATQYKIAGVLALVVGIIVAWRGFSLFKVALCCCATVFVAELVLPYIL